MNLLSTEQIDLFNEKGYVKIPEVLNREIALQMQEEIWVELEDDFGIKRSDTKTWTTPAHSPKRAKISPTNELLINDKFRSIISSLIGKSNWEEPKSWGGFLVNFPEKEHQKWDLVNKLWHWDYELFRQPELGGLLIFSFFSEVLPKGGGTLIVSGSHRALRQYYAALSTQQKIMKHGEQRKHFMKTHPYFKKLTSPELKHTKHVDWFMDEEQVFDGVPLKVVELTGNPGDVVFCHPRLVHAPVGMNHNDYPRIMRTKFLW